MSRMKSIFLVLLLTALVGIVPMAQAQTVEVMIAGSSAMWQTLALGAYSEAGAGAGHWTSASNAVNLTDNRTSPANVDAGTIWIVWNSGATKIWAFDKVDSVVGNRCYFAQPACSTSAPLANLQGSGSQQISTALWGADSALPANIVSVFTNGTPVTVAATDIRPEDAAFAACRSNSALGAGSYGGSASDGLDGLGYNPNNQPGVCAVAGGTTANYVGTPIHSGYPGAASTDAANVVAFNIKGTDPISGTKIPAFTVYEVGAAPIVFVDERNEGQLGSLTNASTEQLQQAFSGANCDASAFGLAPGGISVFLREPLSGTYNTTEATLMRHPTVYPGTILGVSMETSVNAPVNNPLAGQAGTCTSTDGKGARYRAIGTGEEVKSVLNSGAHYGVDGIGFTFFSYGNVGSIANNPSYGYITVNNVDPIFTSYGPQSSTGAGYDPGQPATAGTIPGSANLPASCSSAFPCPEKDIWAGGLSFPNVRNGSYASWSLLRIVSTGTPLKNAETLVKDSQIFVVDSVPDYIPATKTVGKTQTDPGLELVRSHYQQYDGAGNALGGAPADCGKTEAGGDMGGVIIPFVDAKCSTTSPTQQVQGNQGLQVRP